MELISCRAHVELGKDDIFLHQSLVYVTISLVFSQAGSQLGVFTLYLVCKKQAFHSNKRVKQKG